MYKHLAHYYDDLDLFRASTRIELFKLISQGTGKALDVGTGTGISAVFLLNKGYEVDAIDLSSSMIEIAKSKSDQIHWIHGDILTYNPKVKYDLILCSTNVLNHLLTISELKGFIAKIHSLLKPNSIVLFDVMNPDAFKAVPKYYQHHDFQIINHYIPEQQLAKQTVIKDSIQESTYIKLWNPLYLYSLLREQEWDSITLKGLPQAHLFTLTR